MCMTQGTHGGTSHPLMGPNVADMLVPLHFVMKPWLTLLPACQHVTAGAAGTRPGSAGRLGCQQVHKAKFDNFKSRL